MASSVSAAVPLVVQLLASMPTDERESLLEACSLAHQAGPCVDSTHATEADTLRATIDFSGGTRVTLEVTDTDPGRSLYASRELFFDAEDDEEERARAIGLALGVLATTLTIGRPTAPSEEPPPAAPPTPTPSEEPTPESDPPPDDPVVQSWRPWVLSASGGSTLDPEWGGLGPSVAVAASAYPHNHWGAVVRGQGGWFPPGSRSLPVAQFSASAGPTFRTTTTPLFLSASLTVGAQITQARLTEVNAQKRKGSHTSASLHAEAGLGWLLSPALALNVTPALGWIWSNSTVVVDGVEAGSTGRVQLSVLAGVVLLLPSSNPASSSQGWGTQ